MNLQPDHGPFEHDAEVRSLPAVRRVYDAMHVSRERGTMDRLSAGLITDAVTSAGAVMGAHDDRIALWAGNFGPTEAAVIASWIKRAAAASAPGRFAVTFDLAADSAAYLVLTEALRDWADRQRDRAQAEGGNDQRDGWAKRAEELLGAVEAAMDGDR